ncbi:Integrator complex subunit 9-like protein, partial [Drosera capensis]
PTIEVAAEYLPGDHRSQPSLRFLKSGFLDGLLVYESRQRLVDSMKLVIILSRLSWAVLLDCPLDLPSLMIFSHVPPSSNSRPQNVVSECGCDLSLDSISMGGKKKNLRPDDEISVNSLVHSVPWYKTVNNLHLWDVPFIDVVLISRPEGMFGLSFLTRCNGFSGKIYATDVTRRLGKLMIEDLVAMHKEFRQFYGPEGSNLPEWMKMDQLEKFPLQLKEIVLFPSWRTSERETWRKTIMTDLKFKLKVTIVPGKFAEIRTADVKDFIQKVESLKYAEEVCYNGVLLIKAFSSGCGIGACNWRLKGPKRDASYLCSSVCASGPAMNFDWKGLQDSDTMIYSDFSSIDGGGNVGTEVDHSAQMLAINGLSGSNTNQSSIEKLLDSDKKSEAGKLEFVLSCIVDSIRAGGSVLIPMGQLTVMLELLDQIELSQELSLLKVPIFIISSVATEALPFLSILPEWLCRQKQEKFIQNFASAGSIASKACTGKCFRHAATMLFPTVSNRPSLPHIPAVCHPSVTHRTLPCLCQTLESVRNLRFQLIWCSGIRKLREENASVAALEGKLIRDHGRQRLVLEDEPTNPFPKKPALRWGSLEPDALLSGIHGTIKKEAEENVDVFSVHVTEPGKVLVKVRETDAVISTADKGLAARVLDAVDSILDKL